MDVLQNFLNIFGSRFLGNFIEAVPFLLLGVLCSGLIEALIHPSDISKYLPKNRLLAVLVGAFLGILFPVCEYGVIPVARRLFRKGLPVSVGVSFLLAAPVINPLVFASMYISFGLGTVFVLRFALSLLVALSVGLIFSLNSDAGDLLLPVNESEGQRLGLRDALVQALNTASSDFFEMGRYLVLGCLLAALLQTSLNINAWQGIGQGAVMNVLMMQGLAFILGTSSIGDSFVALRFAGSSSIGAILAFLLSASMFDAKNLLMYTGIFRKRAVFYLFILALLMNLLLGLLVNLVLSA